MADEPKLKPATSLPDISTIDPISPRLPSLHPGHAQPALIPMADVPPLGPLLAFKGNWHGRGFNTIFGQTIRTRPPSCRTVRRRVTTCSS